jgi:hypothetical protein
MMGSVAHDDSNWRFQAKAWASFLGRRSSQDMSEVSRSLKRKKLMMASNAVRRCTIFGWIFVWAMVLGSAQYACAKDDKAPYPSMAPLDQYLMDRDAEIAMARSAAPEAISRDAEILVLGQHGYETAVKGKNGFVCDVERSWMGPFEKNPEFWNPKVRGAGCYNPQAARSVLPIAYLRTKLALAGLSPAEIAEGIKAAYAKKELPPVEPGAMSFMMSKQTYLTDRGITSDGAHNMAHVMFFTALMDTANWGANLDNSPILLNPQFNGSPEPVEVYMVCTGAWSDGTPAPVS